MIEIFLSSLVILVVIIDPAALVPLFIALTQGFEPAIKRQIAVRGTVISFIVLVVFAYAGSSILGALGIGMPAFRIAGGLLLFSIAFEMLFDKRNARKAEAADQARSDEEALDLASFPLAVPLISGPGAITSIVLLMSQHGITLGGQVAILAAAGAVILCVLGLLLVADAVRNLLGRTVINTFSRVLGIVVAALATQTVITGVTALYPP